MSRLRTYVKYLEYNPNVKLVIHGSQKVRSQLSFEITITFSMLRYLYGQIRVTLKPEFLLQFTHQSE